MAIVWVDFDDHCCVDRSDINRSYQIFILLNSGPRTLDVNEHDSALDNNKTFRY